MDLKDALGAPIIGPHKADQMLLGRLEDQARMFGLPGAVRNCVPDRWLEEGDLLSLGSHRFEVIHAPGHAPGHVVFFNRDARFLHAGDVLFNGSIGRTDLPGGDHDQLLATIRDKILPLGDDVGFICGHGPGTPPRRRAPQQPVPGLRSVTARPCRSGAGRCPSGTCRARRRSGMAGPRSRAAIPLSRVRGTRQSSDVGPARRSAWERQGGGMAPSRNRRAGGSTGARSCPCRDRPSPRAPRGQVPRRESRRAWRRAPSPRHAAAEVRRDADDLRGADIGRRESIFAVGLPIETVGLDVEHLGPASHGLPGDAAIGPNGSGRRSR